MNKKNQPAKKTMGKSNVSANTIAHTINLAIVGGGMACKYFHSEIFPHKDHVVMQRAVIVEGGNFSKIIFKAGKESGEINNKLCSN